ESALWAAVNSGGAQGAREIIIAIKASADQQFRTDAVIGLTGARDAEAVEEVESFITSGALRLREGRSYFRAVFGDPDRRDGAMHWLTSNFEMISKPIPAEGRARFITYGNKLCSAESKQTVESFFRPLVPSLEGSNRMLSNALEAIDSCLAW